MPPLLRSPPNGSLHVNREPCGTRPLHVPARIIRGARDDGCDSPRFGPRKVSSRLRHVSSSGLYQGLLRGLVDPRDGGQFRWLWSAVPEALGVGGVGRVQGLLPLGADLGRGAEVH